MALEYTKPELVSLKDHAEFNELWLKNRIIEDPAMLGLGDIEVIHVERPQPRAGRLDLLLRDPETRKRYEVEVQLGATDESHIIRCLEYWDIERKRYPQVEHCAVLVAEKITSRFLNVVGLFNGSVPLIAIQVSALRVGDSVILHFTKVLDEIEMGQAEEDEPQSPDADRKYWVLRSSEASVALAEECLTLLHEVSPNLGLTYRRGYIGIMENGLPNNFVVFRPKRRYLRVQARLTDPGSSSGPWEDEDSDDHWDARLEKAGMVVMPGGRAAGWLSFRAVEQDLRQNRELLREVFDAAYRQQQG